LHLSVESLHDRASVVKCFIDGRSQDTPDWRFHRHIVRIGIYLRERLGLRPGQRVAILSTLRPELLVAEWATVAQGATAVLIDPDVADSTFEAMWTRVSPHAAFVGHAAHLGRLRDLGAAAPAPENVVAFDGHETATPGPVSWSEALDLGGTLDTPERAQSFRTLAREVASEMPAVASMGLGADGSIGWHCLNHGEVVSSLRRLWSCYPARRGDLAYVAGGSLSLSARLALFAFASDGRTTTTLGTQGQGAEEIAALRPRFAVAPMEVSERAARLSRGRIEWIRTLGGTP
jgi:hypothetical protein